VWRELKNTWAESNNFSDVWRTQQVDALRARPRAELTAILRKVIDRWQDSYDQTFAWEAALVCIFFGEGDYEQVRQLFLAANREDITRWHLITGNPVPDLANYGKES
jgi:hypothetical protein